MKALLVDDSPSGLLGLQQLVEAEGDLACFAYADPLAAYEASREQRFDIALINYLMPGLDGIELVRRLRNLPEYRQMPIVMLTANTSEQVRINALQVGATDFLLKGADATEIRVRVRNMIDLAAAFRKLNDRAFWLAKEVQGATRALLEREEEMVLRLARAVEYRDNDTGGHTYRVARYSQILAEQLGLVPKACRSLFVAAPLHDVGKVAIPDTILLKPGRLEPEEFVIVKDHAAIGERILGGSNCDLIQLAASIAGNHHERWDGKGYPNGLRGRLIPLAARIVAIADVFDALTSVRPYKAALSADDAFSYIEGESGAQFDPHCVDAFLMARPRILAAGCEATVLTWPPPPLWSSISATNARRR